LAGLPGGADVPSGDGLRRQRTGLEKPDAPQPHVDSGHAEILGGSRMSTGRQVSREPGGSDTAGSTGFGRVKLVEPGRDEGTARVETTPVIE